MLTSNGRYRLLSGVHVESKTTLLLIIYNMSKIKDNHLAEIIIALIIATTLLTSCVEQAESSENMPSQEEYYSNNCENCDEID